MGARGGKLTNPLEKGVRKHQLIWEDAFSLSAGLGGFVLEGKENLGPPIVIHGD